MAGVTSNYTYDKIYELTNVTQGANTTENYGYDPVGNRLSSLGLSPYSYNPSNELVSTPNAIYVYDGNGNLTSKTVSAGTTSYTWDFENRMTSATLPNNGGTTTFKYDPFGRRIYKQSPTATSIFAYDGDNLVEAVNGAGGEVARYTQTQNIDEPLATQQGSTVDYYEADGLGSITTLTATNATVAQSYTYDSFGNTTNSTGSVVNPFRYTAREFDTETGLYYYRARYYDPAIGRFLSEDPIHFRGGLNFYQYGQNEPTVFADPLGLQASHGPEHPEGSFACTWDDDCATLSAKIEIFQNLIAGHIAWDATYNPGRHDTEIRNFLNGLRNCIAIHQAKCTNKPCEQPSPEPAPAPAPNGGPIPVPRLSPQQAQAGVIAIGTIGLIAIMIIFSPVGI